MNSVISILQVKDILKRNKSIETIYRLYANIRFATIDLYICV